MIPDETRPDGEPGSTLSTAIERYIRTIIHLLLKAACERPSKTASRTPSPASRAACVSSMSISVWFTVWVLVNSGRLGVMPFDPYPYGLLTMVVSLEAIFLSTFVLISQNRLGEQSEHRADLDLHIDLLTEYELTRVLQMLDAIQGRLGIENDLDTDLLDLERETQPEEVLAEIERLQKRVLRPARPAHPRKPTPASG